MTETATVPTARARRLFGPVLLLGLAGSGAAAVGGHRAMLSVPVETIRAAGGLSLPVGERSVEFPLAGALALVCLASWGALLVTRGVVRRAVAVLAAVGAAGVVAVAVIGGLVQDDDAAADLAVRLALNPASVSVERSGWLWITLLGGVVALAAGILAVLLVRQWPEMGTRYDAPADAAAARAVPEEERSNLDLWRSLDEGEDPTLDESPGEDDGPTADPGAGPASDRH